MTQPIDPYGSDIGLFFGPTGVGDMDSGAAEVQGRAMLAQRILARLTTRRGTVIDCPNDCLDVRDMLRATNSLSIIAGYQGVIQAEVVKEQEVQAALVTVTYKNERMTIVIAIQSGTGPFTLTLVVSAVTLEILMNGQPIGAIA